MKAATRTWVFQTDKDGVIDVAREGQIYPDDPDFRYLVFGELYRDSDNNPTFPIGTYVLEETEPPTGYNMPDCQGRTFIEVITPEDSADGEHIYTYHHTIYKPIETETGTSEDGKKYTYTGLGWKEW